MRILDIPCGILLAAIGLAATAGNDVVYRWVDANGVVNYAERPPATGSYETIRSSSRQLSSSPAADQPTAGETTPAASPQCGTARENLRLLSSDAPIAQRDEQGNTLVLSDSQRASQLELAQAAIRAYCGEG